jgi:two-component system response regulator DevR
MGTDPALRVRLPPTGWRRGARVLWLLGPGEKTDYHAPEVSTRVLVVENQRLVRQGIRSELSDHDGLVVTEVANGADAIAAASEQRPDVVVLDFELPDRPGSEVCAAILDRHPSTAIIVLSEHADEASVRSALDAGAQAYLLRDADDLDLPHAIERALAGESVIDPRAAAALLSSRGSPQPAKLTSQELKVLRLVAEGLTNPEIGGRLFLSRHTVKEYVSHAMHKLEATNRIEAVRKATALGLIEGVAPASGGETPTPSRPDTLVYNDSGRPARSSDLKVTPLKIDQLVVTPEPPPE